MVSTGIITLQLLCCAFLS